MRFQEIARLAGAEPITSSDPEVTGLAYDSRTVKPGSLFFCIKGRRDDGHEFASGAQREGAIALVCERTLEIDLPQAIATSAREAMNRVSAPFYSNPSQSLGVIGITGTKGKTTTAHLVDSISKAAGEPGAVIGTLGARIAGTQIELPLGTAESADLQELLRLVADKSGPTCALEVTSIGLAEGRLEGTVFAVSVFTNLTLDHVDEYHGTMESYYQAKRKLFDGRFSSAAVINSDDGYGRRLAEETSVPSFTYGLGSDADYQATDIEYLGFSSRLRLVGRGLDVELNLKMPGEAGVLNALAAAAACHVVGQDPQAISTGIEMLTGLPGRFERVRSDESGLIILVDYAHTPASLESALKACRHLSTGRIIVVFGCGGERDKAKRPQMGMIASRLADFAVITSDNPRGEDPEQIVAEILAGTDGDPDAVKAIQDRSEAIGWAIDEANAGDVVLIAGKGHETYQEFENGRRIPFDDRVVAAKVLGARR